MLNRQTLKQYLHDYNTRAGRLSAVFPYQWVKELHHFVAQMKDDSPISDQEKIELKKIINSRAADKRNTLGQLSASSKLANDILDALNGAPLGTTASLSFETKILIKIFFTYLRPEQLVQLMPLNHTFNKALRDPAIWEDVVSRYFFVKYGLIKNGLNVNWFDLFKKFYVSRYEGVPKRTKQLFSSMISADLFSLKILNFNRMDLYLTNISNEFLYNYADSGLSQALRDNIYQNHILPFYKDNAFTNLSKKDSFGYTVLHQAAIFGQLNDLKTYLKDGADVDAVVYKDFFAATPLFLAAQNGHHEVVKAIIEAGANRNVSGNDNAFEIATAYGRREVVNVFIEPGARLNAARQDGSMGLYIASATGQLELVKVMIEAGANPNAAVNDGPAPLSIATEWGHYKIVRELIKAKANLNAADNDGATPLYIAAQKGRRGIVKILIKAQADLNAARNTGETPLYIAAQEGRLAIVKALIEAGANLNAACYTGATPIHVAVAASTGHLEVVKALVEAGANLNAARHDGGTPLSIAVRKGHLEIVKCLFNKKLKQIIFETKTLLVSEHSSIHLGAIALPNLDHATMMTIFSYLRPEQLAQLMVLNRAFNLILRHPTIWKSAMARHFFLDFLKNRSNPDINWLELFKQAHTKDYKGMPKRTKQLFSATKSGDLFSATALNLNLEDLSLEDNRGFSLSDYASQSPNTILRHTIYQNFILLFYQDNGVIDISKKDSMGRTLFHRAAEFGHLLFIKAYLEAFYYNVDLKCNHHRTLLYFAAENGHLGVVKALIKKGAKLNVPRNTRETPIYIAAEYGHLEVVKVLIAAKANVNLARNTRETPIYIAARYGHLEVVKVLIAAKANVNFARTSGATPLFTAAEHGQLEVVRVLIEAKADVRVRLNDGVTPIHIAAQNGYLEIVKVLIAAGSNVNDAHHATGSMPLHIAVQNGHFEIVKELIKAGSNVSATRHDGETPLSIAIEKGHTEIVKLLSHAKLKQIIAETPDSLVSDHPMTLFGKVVHRGYSHDEKLAAAIVLNAALDSGVLSILTVEHRDVLKKSSELAPLYHNLKK